MLGCKLDREGEGTTPKTTVFICFCCYNKIQEVVFFIKKGVHLAYVFRG